MTPMYDFWHESTLIFGDSSSSDNAYTAYITRKLALQMTKIYSKPSVLIILWQVCITDFLSQLVLYFSLFYNNWQLLKYTS
jgi:hypothetical protein